MSAFTEYLNLDEAVKALKGRKGGLRPSRPAGKASENGLMQYVWRMARFHAGHDMTMPTTCQFDLQNWSDAKFGEKTWKLCYIQRPEDKEIHKEIDEFVDKVLEALGERNDKAVRRYRGLLY